jgi:hypothetical protein
MDFHNCEIFEQQTEETDFKEDDNLNYMSSESEEFFELANDESLTF